MLRLRSGVFAQRLFKLLSHAKYVLRCLMFSEGGVPESGPS